MLVTITLYRQNETSETKSFCVEWLYSDRATTCYVYEMDTSRSPPRFTQGIFTTGYARLNPRDNKCYDVARKLTLRRALHTPNVARGVREAIWEAYFIHTAPEDSLDALLMYYKKRGYTTCVCEEDWFTHIPGADVPPRGVGRLGISRNGSDPDVCPVPSVSLAP